MSSNRTTITFSPHTRICTDMRFWQEIHQKLTQKRKICYSTLEYHSVSEHTEIIVIGIGLYYIALSNKFCRSENKNVCRFWHDQGQLFFCFYYLYIIILTVKHLRWNITPKYQFHLHSLNRILNANVSSNSLTTCPPVGYKEC